MKKFGGSSFGLISELLLETENDRNRSGKASLDLLLFKESFFWMEVRLEKLKTAFFLNKKMNIFNEIIKNIVFFYNKWWESGKNIKINKNELNFTCFGVQIHTQSQLSCVIKNKEDNK